MTRWDFFFGLVALLIIETVMVPQVFGLMHFTQWGGMYTDGWCQVHATDAALTEMHEEITIRAGSVPGKRLVWYAPMHTEESCERWSQSWCGKVAPGETWMIKHTFAYFRGTYLLENADLCVLPPPASQWFLR